MRSARATVTESVFLGNCIQVRARLETGEEAVAELPRHDSAFASGERVHLCWNAFDEITFP
jgi:hypothetical protein